LRINRETAIQLRDEGRINDEVLRRIERELDLTESRIAALDNPQPTETRLLDL
jgi:CPA1 family monovalent cation:H+ antiporter